MRKLHALLLVALVTIGFGTMYGVIQQYGRLSANDAPIALATDIANQLNAGGKPTDVSSKANRVDLARSLSPFFVIYTKNLQPVAGTGYLNKQLAQINSGVWSHASSGRYHTVTWQPQSGVRIASVETTAGNYYVLTGQSLKLTEERADRLFKLTFLGWCVSVLCVALVYLLMLVPRRAKGKQKTARR